MAWGGALLGGGSIRKCVSLGSWGYLQWTNWREGGTVSAALVTSTDSALSQSLHHSHTRTIQSLEKHVLAVVNTLIQVGKEL